MTKNLITLLLCSVAIATQGQIFRLGLKAGPNFSTLTGNIDGTTYESRTGFHAGALAEIKPTGKFALQAEALFSAQGAKADAQDLDLSYVAVPLLAKYYLIGDIFALELGPQFSFLLDEANQAFESQKFDLAVAGGASVNITKKFMLSARYLRGVSEITENYKLTNAVFQISIGYILL
jgi:hypothetical protein